MFFVFFLISFILSDGDYCGNYDLTLSDLRFFTDILYFDFQIKQVESLEEALSDIPPLNDYEIFGWIDSPEDSGYDCEIMVIRDDVANVLMFVFRGSDSFSDWSADFDIEMVPFDACEGCTVHNGFNEYSLSVIDLLGEYMMEYGSEYTKMYFVGHSLGGVSCYISAMYVAEEYGEYLSNEIHVISSGAPLAGNSLFGHYVEERVDSIRLVNEDDMAAQWPYWSDNAHVYGGCVHLFYDCTFELGDVEYYGMMSWDDHRYINYQENLECIINQGIENCESWNCDFDNWDGGDGVCDCCWTGEIVGIDPDCLEIDVLDTQSDCDENNCDVSNWKADNGCDCCSTGELGVDPDCIDNWFSDCEAYNCDYYENWDEDNGCDCCYLGNLGEDDDCSFW